MLQIICNEHVLMITKLGFLTRILMAFHVKLTNQRLCNGLTDGLMY